MYMNIGIYIQGFIYTFTKTALEPTVAMCPFYIHKMSLSSKQILILCFYKSNVTNPLHCFMGCPGGESDP